MLTNEGIFYPENKAVIKNETVDGVTGASKIGWTKDGGIPILASPTEDGTKYAFEEFYQCILNKKLPDSNVITGARTAISVNLANNALYDKSLCIGMMAIIYLNRRLKREWTKSIPFLILYRVLVVGQPTIVYNLPKLFNLLESLPSRGNNDSWRSE